jgi:hypothetical protein
MLNLSIKCDRIDNSGKNIYTTIECSQTDDEENRIKEEQLWKTGPGISIMTKASPGR